MSLIQNIIWDFDGTLFDTYPALIHAFSRALGDYGVQIPQELIVRHARLSLTLYGDELAKQYDLDPKEMQRHYLGYYASYPLDDQKPFPGVRQVCEYICSRGGTNVIVTHRNAASVRRLLKVYDMETYFADLITTEGGYPLKPDPAMFEEVIRRCALKLRETLAVGDRDLDIQSGYAAGVHTCLFGPAATGVEPVLRITSYKNLLKYLQELND
jgi:phosphoglycolate phosphatase-like HAD superfamily hydrolase